MKYPSYLAGLLVCSAAMSGCQNEPSKPPEAKPSLVKVSLPVRRTVHDYEEFTGRTDAIESVEVRARVTGWLDSVHFTDGSEVNEGDLLFEIDPRLNQAEL